MSIITNKDLLQELQKQTKILQNIYSVVYRSQIKGVKFYSKGKPMANVVLQPGQSVPVELHYTDSQGNDLGLVPASDNAVVTVDQPAEAALVPNPNNSAQVMVKNNNTSVGTSTVTLTGVAKGFTGTVQLDLVGSTTPPPTPSGVKFVVGTPA